MQKWLVIYDVQVAHKRYIVSTLFVRMLNVVWLKSFQCILMIEYRLVI